jgi:hypothetical protein
VARLEEALVDYEAGLEDRSTNFAAIHRRLGRMEMLPAIASVKLRHLN